MDRALRIAFIGNALPRRCGIATFTTDLQQAVAALPDIADTAIIAMRDHGIAHSYPPIVRTTIGEDDVQEYLAAAAVINAGGYDVVCLQHEFGIFGGIAGNLILTLIAALRVPLVTTLHTVLDRPNDAQRVAMAGILAGSARIIVMADKGRQILIETYGANPAKITVIPHGIPDYPLVSSDSAKRTLGFAGRQVILTFGLISPNKGIETMIDAMPMIVEQSPDALYVIMGATHPNLIREAGESYRHALMARAAALGLQDHVVFLDQFVDRPALLDHIAMCDVYVTPYLVESQMTSGTLAYAHGLGRPTVSTPYWHAAELLADGTGVLVPFADPGALGGAVAALLADAPMRLAMGKKAYQASRSKTWANSATRYVDCFRAVIRADRLRLIGNPVDKVPRARIGADLPRWETQHFTAMCDDTGIFQHAVHNVPDRHHGYCVDDNARALLVCCSPSATRTRVLPDLLTARFASFIQHAWNPDNRRFRNFMGFERRWLEPAGSEDSHGRTMWALGACRRHDPDQSRADWAGRLFAAALATVESFTSPRAWAFTLLGLDDYCAAVPDDREAQATRELLAVWLVALLRDRETADWQWFEGGLSYENARLCEALIRTGAATGQEGIAEAGLRSLRWLCAMQTAPSGDFRPVGTEGFGLQGRGLAAFDQQPVEAAATIAACLAAHRQQPMAQWASEAWRAFDWFLGRNDLAISLVDTDTGTCRDGLHPDRANENCGAESVVCYLLGLSDMQAFSAMTDETVGVRQADFWPQPRHAIPA
ncbi:MAG: glycosyltransferase family 4 protein [Sphingomonas sp.]